MTLGKHEAHVPKLRYRNASNFRVKQNRGGKRMDLAPALCGVAAATLAPQPPRPGRCRITAAWAPAPAAPVWPAGCATWCRAHPANFSIEVVLF